MDTEQAVTGHIHVQLHNLKGREGCTAVGTCTCVRPLCICVEVCLCKGRLCVLGILRKTVCMWKV